MSRKQRAFILDTNIWYGQKLLHTALGTVLLHHIKNSNYVLVLPRIVKLELKRKMLEDCRLCDKAINDNYRMLQTWLGKKTDRSQITDESILNSFEERIGNLNKDNLLREVEIKDIYYDNTLERLANSRPPYAPNSQFADSLIWETCLDLSQIFEIIFISKDGNFKNKDDRTIKKELLSEITTKKCNIKYFYEINDYCKQYKVKDELTLNNKDISEKILGVGLKQGLLRNYKTYGEVIISNDLDIYITEVPSRYAINFKLEIEFIIEPNPNQHLNSDRGRCKFSGSTNYIRESGTLEDLNFDNIELVIDDCLQRSVFVRCIDSGDQSNNPIEIRAKIDSEDFSDE